jgi:hypothetical protein
LNGTVDVAGPEEFRFDQFIRLSLSAHNDPREVVAGPHARYFGTELNERSLVPDDGALIAETRFEDWLNGSISEASPSRRPTSAPAASNIGP